MKRLKLSRETVRTLTHDATRGVAGGVHTYQDCPLTYGRTACETGYGCDSGGGGGGGAPYPSIGGPSGCVECLTK